jgi:transcriptional regulator with XRE-family HTH domain
MIKELRREKGVTQEALAELLGVPQSYVSKYELGERRLDLVEAFEICRALNSDFVAFVRQFTKSIESEGSGRTTKSQDSRHGRR